MVRLRAPPPLGPWAWATLAPGPMVTILDTRRRSHGSHWCHAQLKYPASPMNFQGPILYDPPHNRLPASGAVRWLCLAVLRWHP